MRPGDVEIASVNIGEPETIHYGRRSILTGIRKRPETGPVLVGKDRLDGDAIFDVEHHGGEDQAVCIYRCEDCDSGGGNWRPAFSPAPSAKIWQYGACRTTSRSATVFWLAKSSSK